MMYVDVMNHGDDGKLDDGDNGGWWLAVGLTEIGTTMEG